MIAMIDAPTWEALGTMFMASLTAWRLLDHWLEKRISKMIADSTATQTAELKTHVNTKMQEHKDDDLEQFRLVRRHLTRHDRRFDAGNRRMEKIETAIRTNGNGH